MLVPELSHDSIFDQWFNVYISDCSLWYIDFRGLGGVSLQSSCIKHFCIYGNQIFIGLTAAVAILAAVFRDPGNFWVIILNYMVPGIIGVSDRRFSSTFLGPDFLLLTDIHAHVVAIVRRW